MDLFQIADFIQFYWWLRENYKLENYKSLLFWSVVDVMSSWT